MYEIEVMFRDNGERFIGYGYNVKDMVRRYSKKFEGRTYDVLCVTYED